MPSYQIRRGLLVGYNGTSGGNRDVILMPGCLPSGAPYSNPDVYSEESVDSHKNESKRIPKGKAATSSCNLTATREPPTYNRQRLG